jgi:hypothetical protein
VRQERERDVLRGLREDVPLDHAIRPLRRGEVVGSEHFTEPLGRFLEPPAPSPLMEKAVAPFPRLGGASSAALGAFLSAEEVRRSPVFQPPERRFRAVRLEVAESFERRKREAVGANRALKQPSQSLIAGSG